MFLQKILDLKGTLSFRLAVLYAVIFSISSLLSLSFFYYRVSSIATDRIDDELKEEIVEFSEIMGTGGIEQVVDEIQEEINSEEEKRMFFRLLSNDGDSISSTYLKESLSELKSNFPPPYIPGTGTTISSFHPVGYPFKIRVISGNISPDIIIQVGFSLEETEEYLQVFRQLIISLMIPLLIFATVIGWLISKHAMRGIENVTRTATAIAGGDYDKRVLVKSRSTEIKMLADAFNKMVDRLQALIKGMYEMTDNIAHDLRSPLTRIRGIAEMTLMGKESLPEYKEMAVSTVEECDNLLALINTMLDITETETGVGPEVAWKEIDVSTLVMDACELFHSIADTKLIRLETDTPDICITHGDKNRIQQVITNLLDNALKYTDEGGRVSISVIGGEDQIKISFKDTGIGIPQEDLGKIFKRFYRCDNSRNKPGTGLGLSLVRAIVKTSGGEISVSSTLGHGSVFTVILPA